MSALFTFATMPPPPTNKHSEGKSSDQRKNAQASQMAAGGSGSGKPRSSSRGRKQDTLEKFVRESQTDNGVPDKGNKHSPQHSRQSSPVASPDRANGSISIRDLFDKLCTVEKRLSDISQFMKEVRGSIHDLQVDNDKLREEVRAAGEREERLTAEIQGIRASASRAEDRCEELEAYIRRNNLRVYGIGETGETEEEVRIATEEAFVTMCHNKLQLRHIQVDHIEAIHRQGTRPRRGRRGDSQQSPDGDRARPRAVMVRFVSRRVRDEVLAARRRLKGTSTVIVEDLTPKAYQLLGRVREDKDICQQAWTKQGRVYMKTIAGRIVGVPSLGDFLNPEKRQAWQSKEKPSK